MLPLNSTSCPVFTVHQYLIAEASSFDANRTLTHLSEELGSPAPALVVGLVLSILGLIGLLFGERLVRPTLVVVCALAGAGGMQALLFNVDPICAAVPCIVAGALIALAATLAALLGLFLLNFAFFMGGAAVGIGLVLTFFRFFPALDVDLFGLPSVEGHGLVPFYAAALVAALALGTLLTRRKEQRALLIVITAFISACLVAKGARMVNASQHGPKVPSEAAAAVVLALFLLGIAFQAWRNRKAQRAQVHLAYLPYTDTTSAPQRLLRP